MLVVLALLALLVVSCSGSSRARHQTAGQDAASPAPRASSRPAPRHSPAPLTARVILSSRSVTAGSAISGWVVVENDTGHPVRAWGCLTLFQIILFSPSYRPSPAWAACLQSFIIPVGETSYPVTVGASYLQCAEHGSRGGIKGCLPGGQMPPLPPGTYRARFIQSSHLFPVPPAITIHVTAPRRARRVRAGP